MWNYKPSSKICFEKNIVSVKLIYDILRYKINIIYINFIIIFRIIRSMYLILFKQSLE